MRMLAVLGGRPAFEVLQPVARPTLTIDDSLMKEIRRILESGMLTSGSVVREFEAAVADYLGVSHVVAVSSCTTGLMLTMRVLGCSGEVVLPSFTFMATGHAVVWNGLRPAFADCTADTYTLDPSSAASRCTPATSLIIGVHTFGVPCAADELSRVTRAPLIIDSAHGFGSRYPDGTMAGSKGLAEVFSLTPTKSLAVGEGGLIATSSDELARELRIAREYGNAGDYDAGFAGLNGRLTEINAAIGLAALRHLPQNLDRRAALAQVYWDGLAAVPGLSYQEIPEGARSTFKDFTIGVDPEVFGLTSRQLAEALRCDGIDTRRYFDPPVHRLTAYQKMGLGTPELPVTDRLAQTLLTLPLYAHLAVPVVEEICRVISSIHDARGEIDGLRHRAA